MLKIYKNIKIITFYNLINNKSNGFSSILN